MTHPVNPEWEKATHDVEFGTPENARYCVPPPKIVKPFCGECGGEHEPSGARSDCILFWKRRAIAATDLVEWGRTLLCSATPGKVLDESKSQEWCAGFGKWFSESHTIPGLSHDWGSAKLIYDWLQKPYRVVMCRHTMTFRAVDESIRKYVEADTLPTLCDALLGWPEGAKSYGNNPREGALI